MSWRQFVRAVEADARRQRRNAERAAVQRYRELQRSQREDEKHSEKLRAAHEVERFENYLELLVSLHKDSVDPWDWRALANEAPPAAPTRSNRHEAFAVEAARAYQPGFFERLFGGDKKQLALLELGVSRGRDADQAEHAEAFRQYTAAHALWRQRQGLAGRILSGDTSAYAEALGHAGAFEELAAFRTRVTISAAEPDVIAFTCQVMDDELIPDEEVKLTSTGKLTTKSMAAGRYWAFYQDHLCSCALRVAGDTFAVVPVSRAIVNIGRVQTSTSTGHPELVTFLAVHFARSALAKLNLNKIDPSDSMKNFPHRMKFKKTAGFEPVAAITPDEQWITT